MIKKGGMFMWMIAAVFSSIFAGLTAILAKCGIRKTNSDVITAIRTIFVLLFSIIMVCITGSQNTIRQINTISWVFLILSGLATGASWICYFKALAIGDVNKVVPIDKSSTVISVLLAIILFGETNHLGIKLCAVALIGIGTYLMIERKEVSVSSKAMFDKKKCTYRGQAWIVYAILSAIFAALTSILAKVGIAGVESNLATAIRTSVILIMAWGIVFVKGKAREVLYINRKELIFIALSGIATGASWLCYYYAIQKGVLSVVVPIDKMSILLTVLFSRVFLNEKLSKKAVLGLGMMCLGTLLLTLYR